MSTTARCTMAAVLWVAGAGCGYSCEPTEAPPTLVLRSYRVMQVDGGPFQAGDIVRIEEGDEDGRRRIVIQRGVEEIEYDAL